MSTHTPAGPNGSAGFSSCAVAAMRYHAHGLHPIPCRGKVPLVAWERYQTEQPDLADLAAWWTQWPDANVGLVMGRGLAVVDLDGNGAEDLLRARGMALSADAPRVRTGRGIHVYVAGDLGSKNAVLTAPDGKPSVDVKGAGGYVLAPPSLHPETGTAYEWLVPLTEPVPPAPPGLAVLLDRQERPNNGPPVADAPILEGSRNGALTSLAGTMRRRGMSQPAITAALLAENTARCVPPLTDPEVRTIAASVARYRPDKDSLSLAPLGNRGVHERVFVVQPVAEFLAAGADEPAVMWILDGVLTTGGVTLLVGKPKEGKTTLAYELAAAVVAGVPFLDRATTAQRVLILALEEHPRDVRLRLQALGVGDGLFVACGPLDGANPATLAAIKQAIADHQIGLVILDTLAAFWRVRDENDAASVTAAVLPILGVARETSAGLLILHHARKAPGQFGEEIRGSGALFALADVALILKRTELSTQRLLQATSRYPDAPDLVIELTETGYQVVGDPTATIRATRQAHILDALTDTPELAGTVLTRAKVPARVGYRLLAGLFDAKRLTRTGTGRKGNPYRFAANNALSCGGSYIGGASERENPDALSCAPPSPRMKENPPNGDARDGLEVIEL